MNWHHVANHVVITGLSGSGKSYEYRRRLKAYKAKVKFIFDPRREVALLNHWETQYTIEEMKAALKAGKPICYCYQKMFPGDMRAGAMFFMTWVYHVCQTFDGVKLLGCDEIQKIIPREQECPQIFKDLADDGRKDEIDYIFVVNKGYNWLHNEVRAQTTELVIFRTEDSLPLSWLKRDGVDIERVKKLRMRCGDYMVKKIG